jgi:mannose-6-phosphate isomerase
MIPLINSPQNYHWGKIGSNSKVGQIVHGTGGAFSEDEHYAELWMGTHHKMPS